MEIQINNVRGTKQNLGQIKDRVRTRVRQTLGEYGQRIADTAEMNVRNGHSRTGELAGSISWRYQDEDTATIFASAPHAPYHEFGTGQRGMATHTPPPKGTVSFTQDWKGRPAYPFLHPALKQHEKHFRKAVEQAVERAF